MNPRVAILLILLSVSLSVLLYQRETSMQVHSIDKMQKGLSAILPLVPESATIGYKGEPNFTDVYMWARYIAAPRYMQYDASMDTVLCIQRIGGGDTSLSAFVNSRSIIAESRDSVYRYVLTAKPTGNYE